MKTLLNPIRGQRSRMTPSLALTSPLCASISLLALMTASVGCQNPIPLTFGEQEPERPDAVANDDVSAPELADKDLPPILDEMGFSISKSQSPNAIANTATSALAASFSAPVTSAEVEVTDTVGQASLTFDGTTLSVAALTIINVYPEQDLVYAVLFGEEGEPFTVIAMRGADLTVGAELALDGTDAAAIFVNDDGEHGFVSNAGTLTVTAVDLVEGGVLEASLIATTEEVTLESWPESLFPWEQNGYEAEVATFTGSGSFSAPVNGAVEGPGAWGTASVTVDIEGLPTFTSSLSWAGVRDGRAFLAFSNDTGTRQLAFDFAAADAQAGASIAIDGQQAGAWLLEEDGSYSALVGGSINIDLADLGPNGTLAGSLALEGDAWIITCADVNCEENWEGDYEDDAPHDDDRTYDNEYDDGYYDDGHYDDGHYDDANDDLVDNHWNPGPCSELDTLASTISPQSGAVYTAADLGGELPPGYDRVLLLQNEGAQTGISILIATETDISVGIPLDSFLFEGSELPLAVLYNFSCDEPVMVEGGMLTVIDQGETLLVEGSFTVAGVTRNVSWSVANETL